MKFKIGDVVYIRNEEEIKETLRDDNLHKHKVESIYFTGEMKNFYNKKVIISKIVDEGFYKCNETGRWSWHEDWLKGDKKITLKDFME